MVCEQYLDFQIFTRLLVEKVRDVRVPELGDTVYVTLSRSDTKSVWVRVAAIAGTVESSAQAAARAMVLGKYTTGPILWSL